MHYYQLSIQQYTCLILVHRWKTIGCSPPQISNKNVYRHKYVNRKCGLSQNLLFSTCLGLKAWLTKIKTILHRGFERHYSWFSISTSTITLCVVSSSLNLYYASTSCISLIWWCKDYQVYILVMSHTAFGVHLLSQPFDITKLFELLRFNQFR